MKMPVTCVLSVTSSCNSRCTTCDVWQSKSETETELSPEQYRKLPASLKDINVSGGEPFLRNDLPEIIAMLKEQCPDARIVISSNGLLNDRIRDFSREILKIDPMIGFRVSIDGRESKHDEIRGTKGGYAKAIESVGILKENGANDIGIGLTITKNNVGEISSVYDLSTELGVEFSLTALSSSPFLFGEKEELAPTGSRELDSETAYVIGKELSALSIKKWGRAYYANLLHEFISSGKRPLSCDAAEGFFFLDSYGTVYPCPVLDTPLGNVREDSFADLWQGGKAENARTVARSCNGCFMMCTAKTALRKNLNKAAFWIAANKLKLVQPLICTDFRR